MLCVFGGGTDTSPPLAGDSPGILFLTDPLPQQPQAVVRPHRGGGLICRSGALKWNLHPLEWDWVSAMNSAGTKCGSPAWKTSQTGICTLVYMAMGLCVCFPQEAVRLRTSPPKKPHLCPSPLPTAAWLLSVANVQSHLLSTAKIIKTQQSPVAGSCKTVSKTLHQTSLYLK